ncbi:hypothetical protein SB912_19130 [Pantoea sp. SIMBA_072]
MLTSNGAARTLIAWFTLFLVYSACVLLHYGTPLVKLLMTQSSFYAWDLAMRTTQGDMMPAGVITALLVLSVLAAGSLLATASLFIWHAVPELAVRPERLRRTSQLQK